MALFYVKKKSAASIYKNRPLYRGGLFASLVTKI